MTTRDEGQAGRAAHGPRHRRQHFDQGTMAWPEALGLTALIAFATMLMAGWFNLMLPWVR